MGVSKNLFQSISEIKSTLKIITKTKNEALFIEKWIQHHLAIIGEGKLIIFDHMSDDEHVLNIYEKYKENIILIKFDFHHNDIHSYQSLKDFYDAIAESCDFFTLLDSDEFLYLYSDDNTAIHDTSILDYLRKNNDCDFFAPCWLENIEGEENLLNMNAEIHSIRESAQLTELFDWGKPIVNSKIFKNPEFQEYNTIFQHSLYLPSLNYKEAKTKFFIAHLKNLDRRQRITTNMNKLVVNHALLSNTDFEGLLRLRGDTNNATLNSYIKQTQRLVRGLRANPAMPSKVPSNKIIEIDQENKLHFASKLAHQAFSSVMNCSYLDLINYKSSKVDKEKFPFLYHWIGKY